jgi:hypothetical protein
MVLFGKRLLNGGAARNVRGSSIIKAALLSLTGRLLVHGRPMMCAASVISQLFMIHMVIPLGDLAAFVYGFARLRVDRFFFH